MCVCVEYTSTLCGKSFSFFLRVRLVGEFSSGSNSVNIPNINLQRNHFNQWPGRSTVFGKVAEGREDRGSGIGLRDQRSPPSATDRRCNVPLSRGIDLPAEVLLSCDTGSVDGILYLNLIC